MCKVKKERERESSIFGSLSHVAFLLVFRLLSGSSVVPSQIKQTPKTPSHLHQLKDMQSEGERGSNGDREVKHIDKNRDRNEESDRKRALFYATSLNTLKYCFCSR